MSLKRFRIHTAACQTRNDVTRWDRAFQKCRCPIHVEGTLTIDGFVRACTKETVWDKGKAIADAWEDRGTLKGPPPTPARGADPANEQTGIEAAVDAYLADARDRGNGEAALYKKQGIFARKFKSNPKDKTGPPIPVDTSSLLSFCDNKGIRFLSELTIPVISEWRATWKVNSLVRSKRQGSVIGFFWFCERLGWYPRNYANDMTKGLGRIEVKVTQTGYFMPEEYKKLIDTTYIYSDRPSIDKHNALTIGGHRIRALTELMRWTGLRIRDAVTLERHRLTLDSGTGLWNVILHQRKTGDPVYCPIPPHVADLLNTVPASQKGNANERYFFWTGEGLPKTITSNWQRSYVKLFKLADIRTNGVPKRCHPHMLRDTFAVESILADMPILQVSQILGHSSVTITEKHYLPWVRARQTQLTEASVASWVKQGIYGSQPKQPGRAQIVEMPTAVND